MILRSLILIHTASVTKYIQKVAEEAGFHLAFIGCFNLAKVVLQCVMLMWISILISVIIAVACQ